MSANSDRERQDYDTIVIVGGGCYGGYYVRQLQRAAQANAASAARLVVVDRDPNCAVAHAREPGPVPVEIVAREWREFFENYLDGAAARPEAHARDAIVPSPLMPHLMGEWLVRRARERFGDAVETRAFDRVPDVPWERAGADGTHYVSFATWICPINCVEPRTCPHTRDTRTWSLPDTLAAYATGVSGESGEGRATESAVLFCRHRAYGVGMFDTAEVIAADERIRTAGDRGVTDVVIGTVSHCHGALTRLVIGTPAR